MRRGRLWHVYRGVQDLELDVDLQAVAGLADGELIVERSDASPNPTVEVNEFLPDGTEFKAVCSFLRQSGVAKLVTVHYYDEE